MLIFGKVGGVMTKKFFMAFAVSLVVFFLIYLVFYDSLFVENAYKSEKEDGDQGVLTQEIIDNNEPNENNEILFLLAGVDSKDINEKGVRTDTMMLMNVNFDTGKTSILSIPRDTRIKINNNIRKMNDAHSIGGMALTISKINDLLGLDIEHYVKVDYQVVIDLVEIIGGVNIDVPFLMEYEDPTSDPPLDIYLEKGLQLLNGKNAHDFLRWRKNNAETVGYKEGDVGRIDAQQYFMKELIKQTLNSKNLILKLPSIANTYFKNVETNLPLDTILNGIKMAENLDTENIVTQTLPGEGTYVGEISYFIHDEAKTKALVEELY